MYKIIQIWSKNYKKSQISKLFLPAQIISGSQAPRIDHCLHVCPMTCPITSLLQSKNYYNKRIDDDLTKFILDCTSPNLPADCHKAAHNPCVGLNFAVSYIQCHAISRERARLLWQLKPTKIFFDHLDKLQYDNIYKMSQNKVCHLLAILYLIF